MVFDCVNGFVCVCFWVVNLYSFIYINYVVGNEVCYCWYDGDSNSEFSLCYWIICCFFCWKLYIEKLENGEGYCYLNGYGVVNNVEIGVKK